jgi:peptidoglycan/xylan/chitin deacetylase (PgdA/CDA1 family)
MKISIALKSFIATSFYLLGAVAWKLKQVSKYNSVILMYHRVVPINEAREVFQPGIYVEPYIFERHLRFLKKYFCIVPFSELLDCSRRTLRVLNDKPVCVLTFDDGWYDFYTYAFPILKAHQVPATVFLPTDFIGTKNWFWTDRLTFLFFQKKQLKGLTKRIQFSRNPLVNRLEEMKGPPESSVEKAIGQLKTYRNEQIEEVLLEIVKNGDLKPAPTERAFLSWEEVKEIAQSGLITFGSHTATHRILTTLEECKIKEELRRSKEKLVGEKVGDPAFIPFSYPNGNYDDRIAKMVKDAGYSSAVTTETGWNHHESDRFSLKRIPIHQDITSTEGMLGCRLVGIF